jgi:hypothetical protein
MRRRRILFVIDLMDIAVFNRFVADIEAWAAIEKHEGHSPRFTGEYLW